jgi:23S rRNA pseudouridine1911/1915/1917 synthase
MAERVLRLDESTSERLDRYLAQRFPDLSRSLVQKLIREGAVLVNGAPAKGSYHPRAGDVLLVRLPEQAPATLPLPEELPLRILYEDEHLLVVDKPAGMVVHPAPGHPQGTLVNALLAHRPDILRADLDPQRPGIVHRLDRDTSGLLLVAATREAQEALQKAFATRKVAKTYLALVQGHLVPERGAIEAPIGRDPCHRQRMAVVPQGGRYARTEYRVRLYLPGCTLVEAKLLTGRPHQLRVHFSAIGHPVVGDRVYGGRRASLPEAPRQFLHAWRLVLAHPMTGIPLRFTAKLPEDLRAYLAKVRGE